jgi:hypothetical protein
MTDIDYEALAKAAYHAYMGHSRIAGVHPWESRAKPAQDAFRAEARAVVAALRDQGLVVVDAAAIKRLAVTIAAYRLSLEEWTQDSYGVMEVMADTEQHLTTRERDLIDDVPTGGYLAVLAWIEAEPSDGEEVAGG